MKPSLLLSCVLSSSLALVAARPGPVVVDRLVSRSYYDEERLFRRGSGFANGGSDSNAGKDASGNLKNKQNYEISFYHVNDVHAHLDEFRSSGSSCEDPARGESSARVPTTRTHRSQVASEVTHV